MRALTFFNSKGGTGKTTFTVLMASWLAYKKGCPVVVYDCDYPSYQLVKMRQADKRIIQADPLSQLARLSSGKKPFGVAKAMGRDTFTQDQIRFIVGEFRRQKESADGYMLLDFPGRFLPTDPAWHLAKEGLLDLVVFPIDTDQQSRSDAYSVYKKMQGFRREGQPSLFVWNREAPAERRGRRDWYGESTRMFRERGIPVAGTRMRDILIARRDATTFGFVRNTLCWPQANIDKACPYIENLFEEIKARVDGTYTEEEESVNGIMLPPNTKANVK